MHIRAGPGGQGAQCLHVHALKGPVRHGTEDVGDGPEAVVSAGLEERGCHGDGPHAAGEDVGDVVLVRAAGIGHAELSVKRLLHPLGQRDGQRIEALAAHVHLLARQLTRRDGDWEGVGQLHAELHAVFLAQRHQAAEHRDRVGELQVSLEVMIVKDDVVVAHAVQRAARELVAQQGRVAFDVGVELLDGDEVGGDPLDLVRRATVQRGQGDRGADVRIDAVDVCFVDAGQEAEVLAGPGVALGPDGAPGGVLHALDVAVHLFALDAR